MSKGNRSIVHCVLPKSGLGNQLFPLVKALVFAHLNNLPYVVTGYHQFKIGPYLRREKSKRHYADYFTFKKGLLGEWIDSRIMTRLRKRFSVSDEPAVRSNAAEPDHIYAYTAIPHWDDYFSQLKEHRALAIELFQAIVRSEIKDSLMPLPSPVIGVHIRMGDFRKLAANEDFRKVGAVRTPEDYFMDVIKQIRLIHGSDLPVSVFTDGYRHEFENLFSLPNITLVEGNRDIVDMLQLSRSKIIVTSAGSTFSYWAGFLSDAPIIMHPDHIHESIRMSIDSTLYEGPLDVNNQLLIEKIKSIGE